MSLNTGFTALQGSSVISLSNNMQLLKAHVDVSQVNGSQLANGDWITLFSIPLTTILENQVPTSVPVSLMVLGGMVEVIKVDAGGGTVNIGITNTGTGITSAQGVSALTAVATSQNIVVSTPNSSAAATIYMSAASAALTTAIVKVTLVCLTSYGASIASSVAYPGIVTST
jgi:hypothetical protein